MSPNEYKLCQQMLEAEPGERWLGVWVRMRDCIDHHLEGFYCNVNTGEWKHASHLAYSE